MFRGGRVSAYGTGIASGLADGGMPNKRGLVTGPGGYAGKGITYPQNTVGGDLLRRQGWLWDTLPGMQSYKHMQPRGTKPKDMDWWNREILESNLDKLQSSVPDDLQITDDFESQDVYQGSRPELFKPVIEPAEFTSDAEVEGGGEMSIDEIKIAKKKQKEEAKKQILPVIDGEDTTIGESDLASMVSRYEELLGGKKAKGQDISDMLLRFAGAEGDDTMSKFQKFAAKEADIPSRTEKIKQAAAMLGIKYEQAKDIAAISALGKKFSPGITEKTATYIKSLPKGSPEHATALAQIKWPSTLDRKIAEAQMSGVVTLDDINVWAGVYIDNYKGTMTEESVDGVFLDKQNSTLRWVDENGEVTKSKPLNIK